MAVDTPATIAIVGAGPVGLEAALYARFLGYDVRVYQRGRVVERLLAQPHVPLASPWRLGTTPLGIAALGAQHPGWQPPAAAALLSAGEWAKLYFQPLSQSDLLVDNVFVGTEVLGIERDGAAQEPLADDELPGFRLRVRNASGERVDTADVVIDASGVSTNPDGFGPASASLPGEMDFYIVGAKCADVAGNCLIAQGHTQIRDLFTIVADRATLDLYATIGVPR